MTTMTTNLYVVRAMGNRWGMYKIVNRETRETVASQIVTKAEAERMAQEMNAKAEQRTEGR